MSGLSAVQWLPGAARLVAEARAELPQKDGLAAAFTALAALRAAGLAVPDQDEVAAAAGTVRAPGGPPAGAKGRDDFRLPIPCDAAAAGTEPAALAAAVETLSGKRLRVVPAVPASGEWSAAAVFELLAALWDVPRVAVIARLDPAELGSPDTPERALLDYLHTGVPPLWTNRWRPPGYHHVLLAGVRIGAEGTLVSVVDTYAVLGDNGVHDQPLEWVTAALAGSGALLLIADVAHAGVLTAAVTGAGLAARFPG
ncbi:hypothetical protein [Amycolatopsis sp. FDAARGOS 1241]|uniref:DUF6885 family protein n=1 Tax=Amycolatopsis sp. FDAARGOS 1241 TaxID=2778070 RepID=UPI00194EA1D4|nr:hypothetical protein [Amycolatopsis sp. FDAARGOS 1241]QRP43935.1 hypothetical protein I6J71_32035 [Amycolatopsis sp. FDAARGOS 1241]